MKIKKALSLVLCSLIAEACVVSVPLNSAASDETYGKFVFEEDSWQFLNVYDRFKPYYYMNEHDQQALMQNSKNTEKWGMKKLLATIPPGGYCYGMAATSVLACYDLIDYEAYCAEDGSPTSLNAMSRVPGASEEQNSLITYYLCTQLMDNIRQYEAWGMYSYSDAERLQILIDTVEDGTPAVLIFWGFSPDTPGLGHALVAHDVQYGNYGGVSGVTEEYDGRILIYDPNHNNQDARFYLYFNSEDMRWVLPMYCDSSVGVLYPAIGDVNLLNQGGLLGGTAPYVPENPFMDVFVTNELESTHTIQQIMLQEDGTWSSTDASMDYCKEMDAFYMDAVSSAVVNFLLPGDEHGYVFDVESSQELDAAMYYEDSIAHVYAGNASQTVTDPSGYAAFSGTDTDYTLELVRNEGCYVTDWYDIAVSGHGDSATLRMTEDGYILTADNLENVTISGKNDSNTQTLTVSTNMQSVLIYETEYGLLAAAVDTDGDGSYEQKIAEFALGDVDENDTVDASDAAAILIAAAKMGAGEDSGLTNVQKAKADVNADGEIDASDAALILQYAAEVGSGNDVDSLAEFISKVTKSD